MQVKLEQGEREGEREGEKQTGGERIRGGNLGAECLMMKAKNNLNESHVNSAERAATVFRELLLPRCS